MEQKTIEVEVGCKTNWDVPFNPAEDLNISMRLAGSKEQYCSLIKQLAEKDEKCRKEIADMVSRGTLGMEAVNRIRNIFASNTGTIGQQLT